ncbi:MAG TPA: YdcF family protein [Gaiellaceae bacterium]
MRSPLLLILLVPLAALIVASVLLFILYNDDEVATADAVMVLAGQDNRLPVAVELVRQGVAPVLVISDGLDRSWPEANRLCREGDPERVICIRPEPYTTRGEARLAGRLARERNWDSLVVVTSRFHLFRTRLLFERCFHGDLAVVGARNPLLRLPFWIVLEWVKLGHAALRRGC